MMASAYGRGCRWAISVVAALALLSYAGCQSDATEIGASISAYRDRMLAQPEERAAARATRDSALARPVAWQADQPPRAALLTQPPPTTQPAPSDVLAEIPDPMDAPAVFRERLERLRAARQPDTRVINNYERVLAGALEALKEIERRQPVRLSLAECIQRALQHNYAIRYEAYNPAISQTQVVEAEAAFDAQFFLDTSWAKQDQATVSAFVPGTSDTRSIQGGFRKLLPTGMQTSVALSQRRQKTNFPEQFQTLNPAYSSGFIANFTQPLLRGFGLEYNRATINIQKAAHDIAYEKFIQTVRDRLLDVETTYWRLAQARRTAAVLAETVAQNHATYLNMWERREHDATVVEIANAESRWRTRQVEYQEAVKNVRDAEDLLKNLLNDPDLKLSEDLELLPTETPYAAALVVDQLAAVRTALEQRSEIRQARRVIDQTRIGTLAAKNQTLPQLDLTFQYEVQGIGDTSDNSFDNLTTNRFISYTVSVQFSYPLGNRGPEAALRRARLQESQAVVGLNQVSDTVVQEVNNAARALLVRYAQIPPQLEAVITAERTLRALQARTQRIDPTYLDSELGAVERLAQARSTLLQVIAEYNIAIVALEKAQGTLLEYNNVVVTDAPPDR